VYLAGPVVLTQPATVFTNDPVTLYYLPGTFLGSFYPKVLWNPQAQTTNASFGVVSNQFGFNIIGNSNLVVVVEACADLSHPLWIPIGTNRLNIFVGTNGTSYFSDSQWTNYPDRFYGFGFP
jgi:hypothetical protein